jgi:hypothetical protein
MEEGPIADFWSHGKDLQEEGKFRSALNQLLKEFRKTIDDSSPMAKAIDNNESSEKLAILADKEKYLQLAEIIFLDTLEGDKRQTERRLALGRRQEGRRKSSSGASPEKRQVVRRADTRRDSSNEKRASKQL